MAQILKMARLMGHRDIEESIPLAALFALELIRR